MGRFTFRTPATVNGLLRKRQQVRSWLDLAQGTVAALTANIDAINRTLRLFDAETPADAPRIRPIPVSRHPSYQNDQSRLFLSLLAGAWGNEPA